MGKSTRERLTSKWILVVQEYERVKEKRSKHFKTVEEVCSVYKVNRKDIRHYYRRWVESGKSREALLPRKRGPKPGTTKILSKEEERIILKIRRKLQANEFELFYLLQGQFRVHPSVSTIYRTIKRYPLNKKRKEKVKRYEKRYPGEMGHADTYGIDSSVFSDNKKRYLLGVIDDCTRLCYAQMIPNIKSATVTEAYFKIHKWFLTHGVQMESIMTDNGVEFTAYTSQKAKKTHFFETMLRILGIQHIYTKPHYPQTNGKIERFWKTVDEECLRVQEKGLSPDEFLQELEGFLYRYNYQRRHFSLHHKTPLDKLLFVTEILK